MSAEINQLLRSSRILVCCGAGGVGKTTVATGLALAAARSGRKVLALTVDPSRRLAQTLGVARNLPSPVSVPPEWRAQAGIDDLAVLDAWMLSPQLVADRVVRRFASSPDQLQRLMDNRVYRQITRMVAGMQEYTAMEAVHGFVREGRYDLIVLDTPPSRNALDFLDGPRRLQRFFDGRIFRLFLPGEGASVIRRAARELIGRVLTAAFGAENYTELQDFFASFGELFTRLTRNAVEAQALLSDGEQTSFLLVTSVAPESITDAMFFRRKTAELGLPFAGFLLNRSQALEGGRQLPDESLFEPPLTSPMRSALSKLRELAELEQAEMQRHQHLLEDLATRAGSNAFAAALPNVPGGVDDIESLLVVAGALTAE